MFLCLVLVHVQVDLMDSNFLQKSLKGLLKGLEKVLVESSKALANMSARQSDEDENEEGI